MGESILQNIQASQFLIPESKPSFLLFMYLFYLFIYVSICLFVIIFITTITIIITNTTF